MQEVTEKELEKLIEEAKKAGKDVSELETERNRVASAVPPPTAEREEKKISGGVFGSLIGAAAGACSCGPIGFAVISTFGAVGGTATAFLTNYEIPIRLVAIAILGLTYYTTTRSLAVECKIKN